jgi:hypothetical protein
MEWLDGKDAVERFIFQVHRSIAAIQFDRPVAPGKYQSPLPPWDPRFPGAFFALIA